jgi:hypothetical protein
MTIVIEANHSKHGGSDVFIDGVQMLTFDLEDEAWLVVSHWACWMEWPGWGIE